MRATDDKSRDELAERLARLFFDESDDGEFLPKAAVYARVASRLLESVPGEEALAILIQNELLEGNPYKEWSPIAMRMARFIRAHAWGWGK